MTGVLTDRAVLAISGPEARSFLQGLITNDIGRLAPDTPLYAALLTPQGKVLFDFLLSESDGILFVDCASASGDTLLRRLSMYRLRAKVEIARRTDLAVLWGAYGPADPRVSALGPRRIGAAEGADCTAEYSVHRLTLGVPEGADLGSDKMFALDAGLEELNGVSFTKGCYVGQELTARMKHRGTARKRLLPITSNDGAPLPSAGTEVRAGLTALGEITSTYDARGFALIRLDRWEESGEAQPQAGEQPVQLRKPEWLTKAAASESADL